MIRLILILIFLVVYFLLGIPVLAVEWIIGKFNRYAADISQLRIVQAAFRFILFLAGTKLTVIGEENVPKDIPVLYVCNHRGFFDTVITYSRTPGLTGFVSKSTMTHIPFLSMWMRRLHCLFMNREDVKEALKTILAGVDNIKNGISVCIFPEGTRNRTDELVLPFKEGSFKIASKTDCPVVPIAITNSDKIFEKQFPLIRKTHVTLEYGKPIDVSSLDKIEKKRLGARSQHMIEEMLKKNM